MTDPQMPDMTEEDVAELLIDGARHDDAEDVLLALERHVNVNAADYMGRTALHMASANGHVSMCRTLVDAGADVSVPNDDGNTPLHYACLNGHVEVVKLLMLHGASASALNRHSRTPVDEALSRPFQDAVVAAVNSASKQPLVDLDALQRADRGDPADDEQDEDGDEEEQPQEETGEEDTEMVAGT